MELLKELEELEQRRQNFVAIINVCEYELAKILEREKELTTRTPIWFNSKPNKADVKTRKKNQ